MIDITNPPAPTSETGKPIFLTNDEEQKIVWLTANKIVKHDWKLNNTILKGF